MSNPRISSRLETILPLVKAQIVSATGLDSSLVFSTLRSDTELTLRAPTAQFVAIRPNLFPVWNAAVTGGGNDTLWIDGSLTITYFSRYAADVDFADDQWLLDATVGVLPLWSALIHGLQLFEVMDTSPSALLAEPMRLADQGWEFVDKPPIASWGRLRSYWELKYLHTV